MGNEKYTVGQSALMLGKKPEEITTTVSKGGIKGVSVEPTNEGLRCMLTQQAIDQLGAMYGVKPKSATEIKMRSTEINADELEKVCQKIGIAKTAISRAIGLNENYISQSINSKRMSNEALRKIEFIFGVDVSKVPAKKPETAATKVVISPSKKAEPIDYSISTDTIRGAVFNGVIDAMLVIMKEDQITNIITKALASDECISAINRAVYGAMKGIKANDGRASASGIHAGLMPQVKRT